MASRSFGRGRIRKQVPTTLGRAPSANRFESIDLSNVQKPIETSVFGLHQVLALFETATDEVRRYVAYECDIIYECRTCRSLFRSLANFILHKRSYCQEAYEPLYKTRKADEDVSSYEIISDSAREDESGEETTKPTKNLTAVLKKLAEKQENIRVSEEIACRELSPEDSLKVNDDAVTTHGNKVHLEKIETSGSGVFQTVPNGSVGSDLMKREVMEIHSILNNNEAILQADGKAFSFGSDRSKSTALKPKLICSVCNMRFATKKTLTYHVKYKHNGTRIVYPCPECKDTFANAWCVFRHLFKVHRKTTAQIRKLRDVVHSSPIIKQQGSDTEKEKRAQGDVNSADRENQWLNNLEGDVDLQMCGGCGKRFERKAALHSHSQTCMKRMAVCNSIKKTSEEKPSRQKAQSNVFAKGSKRRKPNILRKMIKAKDKTKDGADSDRGSGETDKEQDANIDMEKTQIEEVIFGNRQADKLEENRNEPIIILHSDDEDTIGFPSENESGNQTEKEKVTEKGVTIDGNDNINVEVRQNADDSEIERVDVDTFENSETVQNIQKDNIDIDESLLQECNSPKDIFANIELDLVVNGITQTDPDYIVDLTQDGSPETNTCETNEVSPSVSITNRSDTSTPPLVIDETVALHLHLSPKSSKKRKRPSDEVSLRSKSERYVNFELLRCNSCDASFTTDDCLMEHMALHFDWFRFQCSKCTFVSYDDKICLAHLENEHNLDPIVSELCVIPLSNWKALKLSSEFKALEPEVRDDTADTDKESDIGKMDKEDPMVRKMIMEVIFGSNAAPSVVNDGKPNTSRSRNCVKTLDKDFVYDMDIVDTQIRHQAALENKVKPIKIIKNNECDFKVINLSPSHQKKKKCC